MPIRPLVPAMLASSLLIWAQMIREYALALFLAGAGSQVLGTTAIDLRTQEFGKDAVALHRAAAGKRTYAAAAADLGSTAEALWVREDARTRPFPQVTD